MDPARWRKIDELVDGALELPAAERVAYLTARCDGDDSLQREVLSLIRAQDSARGFLENSAMEVAAKHAAAEDYSFTRTALVGRVIDTYRVERLIGLGGMGEVYLAHDDKLDRKIALKILPDEFSRDDERIKRFDREARAISALNHPNIVTIYDVGTFDGISYIAAEFVEGSTLREMIGGDLRLKDVYAIGIQICDALSTAHRAGIIHRDIKPENIILRPDGYVKILDFGLAKLNQTNANRQRDTNHTAPGEVIGTPAYMSPEQVAGELVDHRTDLWSVGVVLYELLAGKNPFKGSNRQETFKSILTADPGPVSNLDHSIPPAMDQILAKALEKDADLGYQTAADLRADLKRLKREFDSSPSWSHHSVELQREAAKRRGVRNLALAAAVLLVLVLGGGLTWRFYLRAKWAATAGGNEWTGAKNIQLTDTPWIEGYPSLSPDGKNIVFASDSPYDRNIYLQRVGGKNAVNLTSNSKVNDTMPVYSPDGKLIAFRSERDGGGTFVMEETGENVRKVSDAGYHPSWSPDGKQLVVCDRVSAVYTAHTVPNSSLWIIDVATGEKHKLDTKGDAVMPSWSPDGGRIAFWFVANGKAGDIATIPATCGEPVALDRDPASDWDPVWSPDGRFLYFISDRGGNMNVWRTAVDEQTGLATGKPESIPTPSKYVRHLSFSGDGKTLAYVRYESRSNVQSIPFDPATLKAGTEVSWITRGERELGNPELSPDGTKFVARSPSNTDEDLVIFDRDGSNLRKLTSDNFRERVPRWSPDGKKIAFQSDRSGKYQIWTIAPDGTGLQQVTFSDKSGVGFAVFSPDSLRLAYTESENGTYTPFIIDLSQSWPAQTPVPLPPHPGLGSLAVRDWSNDGNKLLLTLAQGEGDEQGIVLFDFASGRYERMTTNGDNPFWLNDNRNFIYSGHDSIFLCDSVTKKTSELYHTPEYELHHANISPDNKLIFFRYLQADADVWVVDASGR
jgi:serine/threonine protein kinase